MRASRRANELSPLTLIAEMISISDRIAELCV
jgi:hypothetical protein